MPIYENELIENFQVTACLTSFLILVLATRTQSRQGASGRASVSLSLSIVPLLGASRELSFGKGLGVDPGYLMYIKSALLMFVIFLTVCAMVQFLSAWRSGKPFFRDSLSGVQFMVIACFLIVIGQIFEKGDLGFPQSQNAEEIFELAGYLTLVWLAFYRLRILKKTWENA